MANQPKWKLLANLGDVNPIEYGGYFVYVDETGAYPPEAEWLEADEDGTWTVYRFILDRCTHVNGILSNNPYHPDHPVWFAKPESERAARPQDNTYLKDAADCCGTDPDELAKLFCSADPLERAEAYRVVGLYHGFANLDQYPLQFTSRKEVSARYA
jgi:hypothetical protein